MHWVLLSLLASLGWTLLNLAAKVIKVPAPLFLVYQYFVAGFVVLPLALSSMKAHNPLILALLGVVLAFSSLSGVEAVRKAPNPGYAVALINTNIALVYLASLIFLGSKIEPGKVIGLLLVFLGALLLVI